MSNSELELYSTSACRLCELAEALLVATVPHALLAWQCYVVDVADDDRLLEDYGARIPVVRRCDSGAELQWPFDGAQLLVFLS